MTTILAECRTNAFSCGSHDLMLAVHQASPVRQGKVVVDIGANKGVRALVILSNGSDLKRMLACTRAVRRGRVPLALGS